MPGFALVHTDDKLGLATAGDIVLTEAREALAREVVDILSEQAVPIKGSAKKIKGVWTFTSSYELKDTNLVVPLGVDVGADSYRIRAVRASCNAEGYPTVTLTAVKPAEGSFQDTPGTYGSLTITGGFGVVDLWGGTCDQPTESSCNISSQQALAVAGTDGNILTLGMVLYAYRQECTLAGYTAVTIPIDSIETSDDTNKEREGFSSFAKSWNTYLVA